MNGEKFIKAALIQKSVFDKDPRILKLETWNLTWMFLSRVPNFQGELFLNFEKISPKRPKNDFLGVFWMFKWPLEALYFEIQKKPTLKVLYWTGEHSCKVSRLQLKYPRRSISSKYKKNFRKKRPLKLRW